MAQSVLTYARRFLPDRRRVRVAIAAGGILVFTVLWAGLWTANVSERAESLARELRSTAGAAQTTIGSADVEAIPELRVELTAAAHSAQKLRDDMWPMRIVGFVVGWYPVLGDNVTAAPDLADRLVNDIDAALQMLDAAERLVRIYDEIPDEAGGIAGVLNSLPDQEQIGEIRAIVLASNAALIKAEATADEMHDGRLWGRLGGEARDLRLQEEELRGLIDWTLLATDSLLALSRLADAAGGLTAVLDSGDASGLTVEALKEMPALESFAAVAFDTVSAAASAASGTIADSPIGTNLRDLAPVLEALHATARSGALVADVVIPAFDHVEDAGAGLFGQDSGLLTSIAVIGLGARELQEAEELLMQARSRLTEARGQMESTTARSAADALLLMSRDFERAVSLLRELPELAPDALGASGERRYLVLAESADEIRASGGFVSGAWILTFDNGALTQSSYQDVVAVDDLTNLDLYPTPPQLLARYMDAPVWLMRDVSWEPNFPSVAQSAAEILAIGQDGLRVDGVIAITQWAMLDLAEALGSIETDDGPLPSNELLAALETGTDEEGRAFMNTLFRGLLSQISSPAVNDRMFQLARAASKTLAEKQTLVHMFDSDLQAIVTRAGWDGAAQRDPGDRIDPIDSNIGWSKVDRNIKRSLKYEVVLNRSGVSTGTVTLGYENLSDDSASGCDSQRMDRGRSYVQLKNACYWNLIRVYTADGASLISASRLPLPENSVIAGLGLASTGDDTVSVGIDPAGSFVSGLLIVPPGETVETSFVIKLPDSAIEWTDDVSTYRLNLSAQPGTLGRETQIRIELPAGQVYVGGSMPPSFVNGRTVEFDLHLREDTSLTVAMRPAEIALKPDEPGVERLIASPVL